MRVVRNDILHALKKPCGTGWKGICCLSCILLPLVLGDIREVRDAAHEVRAAHCPVGPLPPHVLVVPREMRVEMLLESHVPDEPKPADTALKLDALVNLGDREYIKPKRK